MQCDVPLGDNFFVGGALLDATLVVPVLEEECAPVLDRRQLDDREQRLLLDRLDHERDEALRSVKRRTLSRYDQLVEVREDHIAAKVLQVVQELEEVLLH